MYVICSVTLGMSCYDSRFEDYLAISPRLYPINCLKSVSPEIRVLKDHLCEVRAKLLEVIVTIVITVLLP